MKALFAVIASAFLVVGATAQTQLDAFPLWKDGAPGAKGTEPKDIPTLTPFLPDPAKATGAAIVVCPGGGYGGLADHEGSQYARWLNEQGVAGFVLKYRLGSAGYRHPVMLQDAARALRTLLTQEARQPAVKAPPGIPGGACQPSPAAPAMGARRLGGNETGGTDEGGKHIARGAAGSLRCAW